MPDRSGLFLVGVTNVVKVAALFATLATVMAYGVTHSLSERDSLRRIVQTQCMESLRLKASPAPCQSLEWVTGRNTSNGYAIVKDRKPGAHFLLVPVRSIAGIESPELYAQSAPNFIAAAWRSRSVLDDWVGKKLPPESVGLAVNPRLARGQDQFHIHIECLGTTLSAALDRHADDIGLGWAPLLIDGRRFLAMRIPESEIERRNPLQSLAASLPDSAPDRGTYSLIVAGHRLATGEPGLIFLAVIGRPNGESMLDSSCRIPQVR